MVTPSWAELPKHSSLMSDRSKKFFPSPKHPD